VTLPLFLLGLAEVLQVLQLIIAWLEKKKKRKESSFHSLLMFSAGGTLDAEV